MDIRAAEISRVIRDQIANFSADQEVSEVGINATVDPSLLGGIVVRLGSQMIDASIRTKLNTLALAMRG